MFGVVGDTDATHPKRRHGSKNKSWGTLVPVTKSTSQGRRVNNIDKVYQHTTTELLYIIYRTLYTFSLRTKSNQKNQKSDSLIMGSSRIEYSEKYADDAYEYR